MGRRTRCLAGLVIVAVSLAMAAACGGDDDGDDFADIRATATAAASAAAASPTVDPMADYMAKASKLAADLAALHDALFADLLAAQANQSDPKWPGVLTSDTDRVVQKALELRNLPQPAALPPVLAGKIGGLAQAFSAGAALLKDAVLRADPTQAAQAVQALDQAATDLDALRAELK